MADVHSKEKRSFNISRIRSKDTKPEMLVRRFLFANGFRYKLHDKSLPGKPGIVLLKYKTVIFINCCFRHGHEGCSYFVVPKTRTEWWTVKINKNKVNDAIATQTLPNKGWRTTEVWECNLKKSEFEKTSLNLIANITGSN